MIRMTDKGSFTLASRVAPGPRRGNSPVLHREYLRGADEVWWRELHVDGGAGRVKRAPQLIAHRQHLDRVIIISKA